MKKIVALLDEIRELLPITYSEGIHFRPMALLSRLQTEMNVQITFKGKDLNGQIQEYSASSPLLMAIGSCGSENTPNILEVKIVGDKASEAMKEIRVLMASNFGLKPISAEIDEHISEISLVSVFNELKSLYPEAKIVIENDKGISLSQVTSVEQLERMGFFDASKRFLAIENQKSFNIFGKFLELSNKLNNRVIDIESVGVLNRGFSVPSARLVVWRHPSLYDKIDLDLLKPVTAKEYAIAKQKTIAFAEERRKQLFESGEVSLAGVYDIIEMIVNDSMMDYETLLKKSSNSNVVAEVINLGRNMLIPSLMHKNRDDMDEILCVFLRALGVENFNRDFDVFVEEQRKIGPFLLVSNKFPFSSSHALGARDGILGFIGVNGCSLSQTAHPVLVAKNRRVPVVITDKAFSLIEGFDSASVLVSRDKGVVSLILDPSKEEIATVTETRDKQIQHMQEQRGMLFKEKNVTADGREFKLHTNVDDLEETIALSQLGLFKHNSPVGIGLVRTELLYGKNVHDYSFLVNPMKQLDVFVQLFSLAEKDVPVRIRMLDQDASKFTGLKTNKRGQGLMESNEDVYRAQIVAILEAAVDCGRENVQILFPMVNSVEHANLARGMVLSEISNLALIGRINVQVYAMIEDVQVLSNDVLDGILDVVDGISLGTNDFAQSIGQDRLKHETFVAYNPLEYFMYKDIITRSIEKEKDPCVCGGQANNPNWSYLFTALGASVSPSPNDLHVVKQTLVNSRFSKFAEAENEMINNTKISMLLNFVADKMKVSKEELLSSPALIASFYSKLKHLNNETKKEFKLLLDDSSNHMQFILNNLRSRELGQS